MCDAGILWSYLDFPSPCHQDEMRKREEEEQRKIVEEERQRLLQQNVDRLVGHIPRGVLSQVLEIK